jgi:hypothetical protein
LRVSNQIQVNLINATNTGNSNSQNTKWIVNLLYYLRNNNGLVNAEFAANSINLLSGQEMAQHLGQEVTQQGYAQAVPLTTTPQENKLWIIGAVIGPLLFIIIIFWIVACFYYTCVNPKKKIKRPRRAKRLAESPLSVSYLIKLILIKNYY